MGFRLGDQVVYGRVSDSSVPVGHCLVQGRDGGGTDYLWLFEGDAPAGGGMPLDEAFKGALRLPPYVGGRAEVRDAGGEFVASGVVADAVDRGVLLGRLVRAEEASAS